MKSKFKGKKSRSFGYFLLICSIIIIIAVSWPHFIYTGFNLKIFILSSIIVIPILILFIWFWLATYYIISKKTLIVKWGPFYWKVPIKEITIIRLNQNTFGGTWKLTLSWKSMEIKYKKYRAIFISPENEKDFLEKLLMINDKIEIKNK